MEFCVINLFILLKAGQAANTASNSKQEYLRIGILVLHA